MNTTWTQLPDKKIIDTVLTSLSENGFNPIFAETIEEAKEKALSLIPKGAEVMTMTSETLRTIGLDSILNESGDYDSVRAKLVKMDRTTQGNEMRKLGSAPDYAIGSVHAVTQDGHVLIASRTGSQLPAYVYGAGKVIWVVGTQKIVKDIEEGKKRIFQHTLPLESERANKAYHMTSGSQVDKLLTYYKEVNPTRITLILVNQPLGF
ncbi:MAG TPA: LUD domain-containing protein [Candidatus Eisenbacteria bacterium]|nr:LUD domain-containing protein [Candidatus Eisenbacteria bacterium]